MSWQSNVHPAGVPLHVIRRGNARAACFFGERDRLAFHLWLCTYAMRFECCVHAYVLMGNHVHLLLTPSGKGGAADLMEALCERYARYVGKAHERTGPVWEKGFEASAIHVRRHLLSCMRYIELNPVRAQLVTQPGAYRWSSYGANAMGRKDGLITPHPYYYALGRSAEERQTAYRHSFERAIAHGRSSG